MEHFNKFKVTRFFFIKKTMQTYKLVPSLANYFFQVLPDEKMAHIKH